jgi:hypothetical protein
MAAFWTAADGLGVLEPRRQRVPAADVALVASLLVFLCVSYLYCVCSRRIRRDRRRHGSAAKEKKRHVFVRDMEEPLLGPPEYEQPPALEVPPPAYEYLPSAPPLSWEGEHGQASP